MNPQIIMYHFDLITSIDFYIAPLTLVILILLIKKWSDNKHIGEYMSIKRYVFPAFFVRILGCILSTVLYQYYYKLPADAHSYYETALTITHIIYQNPIEGLDILFSPINNFSPQQWNLINTHSNFYVSPDPVYTHSALLEFNPVKGGFRYESNALICRIGTIISLLTLKSYLSIGFILTTFSFMGCWKLFTTFYSQYPNYKKELALSTLFLPSLCFWGAAGLMKETLIVGAMGFFVHYSYIILRKKPNSWVFFKWGLSFAIVAISKLYIGMILIPTFLLWMYLIYKQKFKSKYYRFSFLIVLLGVSYIGIHLISKQNNKFNLSNILNYAFDFQKTALQYRSDASYDLGEMTPSVLGIVLKIPQAINVSLFRPYLWEVKKIVMLPSALESFLLFLATLLAVFNVFRQENIIDSIKKKMTPEIIFCLSFSFLLFLGVGFTSYNFGTLARYRMLGLPFFCIFLSVLSEYNKRIKFQMKTKRYKSFKQPILIYLCRSF